MIVIKRLPLVLLGGVLVGAGVFYGAGYFQAAREKTLADRFLKSGETRQATAAELIGASWTTGAEQSWREIYYFAPDGSLPVTVVEAGGVASAQLLRWKIAEGLVCFLDGKGETKRKYRVLGYLDGRVYVKLEPGGVEIFTVSSK